MKGLLFSIIQIHWTSTIGVDNNNVTFSRRIIVSLVGVFHCKFAMRHKKWKNNKVVAIATIESMLPVLLRYEQDVLTQDSE
jgi:hypothetical protein